MAIIEQIAFYLGAALLTGFVLFFVFEALLRAYDVVANTFFYESVTRSDYIDPEYHPYLNVWEDWSKPMFRYHPIGFRLFNTDISIPGRVTNNQLGFRCDEFTDPDPDELRVILLGGSSVWGSGASSNETTIAGQLEKFLNEGQQFLGPKKRAKCFNLAQLNGFQTQDILTLAFFARKIRPDIIVSFSGWNELIANYPMTPELLKKYGVFYVDEMAGWEPHQVADNRVRQMKKTVTEWATYKSRLFGWLKSLRAQAPSEFDYSVEELKSRIRLCSELFIDHLETLEAFSASLGARHFQFLQPNLYWKKTQTPEEQRVITLYDEVRPAHGGKVIGDYLRENKIYADVLNAAASRKDISGPVIDLSGFFENESAKIFYTLVHMTDEGQKMIAQRLHKEIAKEFAVQ